MRRNQEWWCEIFREDAGEKFRGMDDSQFSDWKRANPGAASKANKLRGKPQSRPETKPSSSSTAITKTQQKQLPGSQGGAMVKQDKGAVVKKEKEETKPVGQSKPLNDNQKTPQSRPKPTTPIAQRRLPPGKDTDKPKVKKQGMDLQKHLKSAKKATGDALNATKELLRSRQGDGPTAGDEAKNISGGVKASSKNVGR